MARQLRQASETGIHHVMLRGVNRQRIFEEDADYESFVDCLSRAKQTSGATLYAYCCMSNHVHLLIREGDEPLAATMKRVEVRYAGWFNRKYRRVGHLFQDRYASRAVNDDGYFLMVLQYIHFNPVAAGLCARPEDYAWSSRRTLGLSSSLLLVEELERIVPLTAVLLGEAHHEPPAKGSVLQEDSAWVDRRIDDGRAWTLLAEASGALTGSDFQRLSRQEQRGAVVAARSKGVSVRQIARLTGLSTASVHRWGH